MVLLEVKTEILYGFIMIFAIIAFSWMTAECYRYCQSREKRKFWEYARTDDEAISLVTTRTEETFVVTS